MKKEENRSWVAIVYDGTDKINSRVFRGDQEETIRLKALKWATKLYGKKVDWSLHEINKS